MFGSAPGFWWRRDPGWQAHGLSPLGTLYGAIARRRMGQPGTTTGVPTLCIGNFTAGGAGKTPTAIAVARRLQDGGHRPMILSRGYGRAAGGEAVVAVDVGRHGAREVGDEPLLLARQAPTFVAKDRARAAEAAVAAGASVLIMDDGFQSPALIKTASIVVVDGAAGVGNGLCLPAGPLRAPLAAQWAGVSLLCVIGPGEPGERLAATAAGLKVPVALARLEADAGTLAALAGRRLFAFSGIGRPAKFFDTLEAHGLDLAGRRAFGDHHPFDAADRERLTRDAARLGAELVTTEKDNVRLPGGFATHVLPVRLVVDAGAAALDDLLARIAPPSFSPA